MYSAVIDQAKHINNKYIIYNIYIYICFFQFGVFTAELIALGVKERGKAIVGKMLPPEAAELIALGC